MTIHHDKMAYGKLDSLSEKFSEDRLRKMAELLSENGGGFLMIFHTKEKGRKQ